VTDLPDLDAFDLTLEQHTMLRWLLADGMDPVEAVSALGELRPHREPPSRPGPEAEPWTVPPPDPQATSGRPARGLFRP
jgi:hypothetical protein